VRRTPAARPRRATRQAPRQGFVSLVGAGPGDPGLLTLRALDRLRAADLVLYDGLVSTAIVALAEAAEKVSVARRVGPKTLTQDEVSARIIAGARAGFRVVRLKSGDPFVFGRGGEEAQALAAAGIPFEIVPGVSSVLAAPALAGIPVTHRGVSAAIVVVSGHAPEGYETVLSTLAPGSATVVVMMGFRRRRALAQALVRLGWKRETPAAVIVNASRPNQRVWSGRLSALGTRDGFSTKDATGILVIGEVVSAATSIDAALPVKIEEQRPWQPMMIRRH
jgi:uroporphyrin-III C-methyltransferase / precorrin-2 dehydrogenase / sirohydrochlorin ferrochelatase